MWTGQRLSVLRKHKELPRPIAGLAAKALIGSLLAAVARPG
jgi:hypothetical protein